MSQQEVIARFYPVAHVKYVLDILHLKNVIFLCLQAKMFVCLIHFAFHHSVLPLGWSAAEQPTRSWKVGGSVLLRTENENIEHHFIQRPLAQTVAVWFVVLACVSRQSRFSSKTTFGLVGLCLLADKFVTIFFQKMTDDGFLINCWCELILAQRVKTLKFLNQNAPACGIESAVNLAHDFSPSPKSRGGGSSEQLWIRYTLKTFSQSCQIRQRNRFGCIATLSLVKCSKISHLRT